MKLGFIGFSLATPRASGGASGPTNPITGTGPVLAALMAGDTLSDAVTWGSYEPEGAEATQQMRVDGGEWLVFDVDTEAVAGEVWQVREVVEYEGFTRRFTSEAVTVAEAPVIEGWIIAGSMIMQSPAAPVAPTVSGSLVS